MPLNPPVAEDLLMLLDKYSYLTPVQKAILKSAAVYLVEDTLALTDDSLFIQPEPRLLMNVEEYRLLPDRIELIQGIPHPKHWETPNLLASAGEGNGKLGDR